MAGGPEVSVVLMGVSLLVIVKGCDGKFSYSKCCSGLLFIYFFIFKIYFFMYLFYIVEVIDISTLYCSKSESTEAKNNLDDPELGNFDFLFIAMLVYYPALIVLTIFKRSINLLIYAIIGLGITLIMFFSLFAINARFAGFTLLFIVLEVGIFLLVLKLTRDKLEGDQFINNMLLIDYLKYYVIMIISAVVLTITVYIIYCFCAMLKCFSEKRATTADDEGNVYDQFGNFMEHYSRRPEYVDQDGNVYDTLHNKIQPDGCNVF